MTRKGILFVMSGPSGVGKGTIKEALLAQMDDLHSSISVTTRCPRVGEIDARDYFFVNEMEFNQMIQDNQLLEWAEVYSHKYGTPRQFVHENIDRGHDVLLEIDIQGAMQVKQREPNAVFIFIVPPSRDELAKRLCSRGKDSQDTIEERLAAVNSEMEQIHQYDYMVVNAKLKEAVNMVAAIVKAERCKVTNNNINDLEVI